MTKMTKEKVLDLAVCDGVIALVDDSTSFEMYPALTELLLVTKQSEYKMNWWTTTYRAPYGHVTFINIEEKETSAVVDAVALAVREMKKRKVSCLGIDLSGMATHAINARRTFKQIVETCVLVANESSYPKPSAEPTALENLTIAGYGIDDLLFNESIMLAEMTLRARVLVNEPANVMTPSALAEAAKVMGDETGFEVEIMEREVIAALQMTAFLSVAKGSEEQPKLIVMRYTGDEEAHTRIGLIGKGLTYDSGGLSIKPTSSMVQMKNDMGGAAAVIGAMGAIAKQGLKMNVVGVVAACENMISGAAYKPGDIIDSMGGKRIYIGNTDAEGRLTLIDAIHYAIEKENVTMLFDIATLTGAARHCLGDVATPIVSNDETLVKLAEKAFSKSGERVWQMPNFPEFHEQIKHAEADLNNSGGQPGVSTSSAFLEAFVQGKPWIHFDIGATAYLSKARGADPIGATGVGVRGLYHMVKKLSK
ncbi:leucyl aminopeptidase [Fusibacter paucivorans]|uniref:Probable cytosol aminopeptidase n=1 Tax=Fusibacter paucivorans TaxID=76009 RepID=A0ABS5PKT8_9FIRM|nr:leucyl aminopeptidase [Fusibacter paucivorans]MBS7525733.1 leucyl aminopeptidase [Fusibacter paucivorans]